MFAIRLLVEEYGADLFTNPRVLCVACLRGYVSLVEYMLCKLKTTKKKQQQILNYCSEEKIFITRHLILKEKLNAKQWVKKVLEHEEKLFSSSNNKTYRDNLIKIEKYF